VVAPVSGEKLTIKRVVDLTQTSEWQNGAAVEVDTFESGLDKLTDALVQIQEQVDRSPKFKVSSAFTGIGFPELVAGKAIRVSDDGSSLICSTDNFDSIVTNATAQATIATTQAGIATAQAGTATTQATNSANSATLASQWASQLTTTVASTDFSAKEWAIGTATTSAKSWATSLALVDGVDFGAKKYAQDAAGHAAALNLPGIAGNPLGLLRVKSDETGYELRSPSQVLSDIGAASAGHAHTGVYEPANTNLAKINTTQTYTASQRGSITTLTDGATITPDFAVTNDFVVTFGGNRTIANPTNITVGQKGVIVIRQDATGSRTVAWGTYYKWAGGVAPTLSKTANAVDRVHYHVVSATEIHCQWVGDFK
jgi:hypothetical protein